MGDHDHSYKLLFAHPRMVRDLLETFVSGDWLTQADFGSTRWYAAEDLDSLLQPTPPDLEKCRPALRYLSIDEGSYDDAALARHDNLVASLFRLEQCRELDRVEQLVSHLVGQLKETGQESLRRAFAVWLDKVILKRLSGECTTVNDLWEKHTMLSERFDEWEAQFLMEGRRQGRQEGMREGWKAGEAALLTRQLQKRFGELPEPVSARMREAGPDQLEHWGERLLEASTLDEVFVEEQTALP